MYSEKPGQSINASLAMDKSACVVMMEVGCAGFNILPIGKSSEIMLKSLCSSSDWEAVPLLWRLLCADDFTLLKLGTDSAKSGWKN